MYQETFEGENFHKFRGFVAIHESPLGAWHLLAATPANNPESFLRENPISTKSQKFLPQKFSAIRYSELHGCTSVCVHMHYV